MPYHWATAAKAQLAGVEPAYPLRVGPTRTDEIERFVRCPSEKTCDLSIAYKAIAYTRFGYGGRNEAVKPGASGRIRTDILCV